MVTLTQLVSMGTITQVEDSALVLSMSAAAFLVSHRSGQSGSQTNNIKTLLMKAASVLVSMIQQTGERKTLITQLAGQSKGGCQENLSQVTFLMLMSTALLLAIPLPASLTNTLQVASTRKLSRIKLHLQVPFRESSAQLSF